jgi:transposase
VTTFYFESEVEKEGELRQMGFGKDGKIGNTQILFCMMIDRDKNPIGYRIFKGDTYEGHTFEKALEDLKNEYQIACSVFCFIRLTIRQKKCGAI